VRTLGDLWGKKMSYKREKNKREPILTKGETIEWEAGRYAEKGKREKITISILLMKSHPM